MKRFLLRLTRFLLPILALLFVMEIALRAIPNDYRAKRKHLEAESESIATLVLGSSHSLYGVNPDHMSTVTFNLAHLSQTLDIDLKLLQKYGDTMPDLQVVILPISYFSLRYQLADRPWAWRLRNYEIYYGLDVSNSINYSFEILTCPFRTAVDRLGAYYLRKQESISISESGWAADYAGEREIDFLASGEDAANRHLCTDTTEFPHMLAILTELIEWCQSRNVRVLLFTPPAHETYCACLDEEQLQQTITTAGAIAGRYPNCEYLNLLSDRRFVFDDFDDPDHLNAEGAAKLSRILDEELQRSWELCERSLQ